MLSLSLCLVHESLVDWDTLADKSVYLILDLLFLFLGEPLVVCDVDVSFLFSLLGSGLPDVRSEDLTAGSEDKMGARVVGHELQSSRLVDTSTHRLPLDFNVGWDFSVQFVHGDFSNFNHINHIEWLFETLDFDNSSIVLLSS